MKLRRAAVRPSPRRALLAVSTARSAPTPDSLEVAVYGFPSRS